MATICQAHPDTIRDALKTLCAHGWILAEERHGKTTVYRPRIGDPLETKGGVESMTPRKRREGTPRKAMGGTPRKRRETKKTLKKTLKKEVLLSDLPFDSKEFSEAWEDWMKYRKEIRKPLTSISIKAQLDEFSKEGEVRSIDTIRKSIKNGWQGVFFSDSTVATKDADKGEITSNGRIFRKA